MLQFCHSVIIPMSWLEFYSSPENQTIVVLAPPFGGPWNPASARYAFFFSGCINSGRHSSFFGASSWSKAFTASSAGFLAFFSTVLKLSKAHERLSETQMPPPNLKKTHPILVGKNRAFMTKLWLSGAKNKQNFQFGLVESNFNSFLRAFLQESLVKKFLHMENLALDF